MHTIIDPFQIATMGVSGDPITIATNGWIVYIDEEVVDVVERVSPGGGVYEEPWDAWKHLEDEKKKKKKITARVIIDGQEYSDTIYLEDLSITAKDVSVEISDKPKPNIKIQVMIRYIIGLFIMLLCLFSCSTDDEGTTVPPQPQITGDWIGDGTLVEAYINNQDFEQIVKDNGADQEFVDNQLNAINNDIVNIFNSTSLTLTEDTFFVEFGSGTKDVGSYDYFQSDDSLVFYGVDNNINCFNPKKNALDDHKSENLTYFFTFTFYTATLNTLIVKR